MREERLGHIFVRHLMMAIPWGIVFLVVFFIAAFGIKQEIKEGIQYTAYTFNSVENRYCADYHHYMQMKMQKPVSEPDKK